VNSLSSNSSVTVSPEAYDNLRGRAERYAVRVQELAAERDRYRDLLRLLVADVEEAGVPQRHSRLLARAREALER
jgi:hypothetical protein